MSKVIDALGYYEEKAMQMQRASLRGDSKAMLSLMQDLAVDGGAIARRAIDSQAAPAPSTVAVDAGAQAELRGVLFDIIEWFDAGDVEAARECAARARRLMAGGA